MGAEVRTPKYQGVDVDHPQIVAAIKTAAQRGMSQEAISKVVGMPPEVVRKHMREVGK